MTKDFIKENPLIITDTLGYAAYTNGKAWHDNPFTVGSKLWERWNEGFQMGNEEKWLLRFDPDGDNISPYELD